MDFAKMIEAARAENASGVMVRGGKRYTSVAKRIDLFRRHAGGLSLATEIVRWGAEKGAHIVIRAVISDETGRVLATGHAEEVRGLGQVNSTSALENAETSAIGRALAAFGLSGGEFASANEMDAVARKEAAPQPETVDHAAEADRIVRALTGAPTLADLAAEWKAAKAVLAVLRANSPEDYARAEFAKDARKIDLSVTENAA